MNNIIGLTDSTKVITSSSLLVEPSGMQVLSQTIVVTSEGMNLFMPKYLDPHPDFPTMAVESVSTKFLVGGLVEITIQYVGLLQPGAEKYISTPSEQIPRQPNLQQINKRGFFPKANYNLLHNPGNSLYFPYIVELQFIDIQNQKTLNTLTALFNPLDRTRIPTKWRDTNLPASVKFPFTDYSTSRTLFYYGIVCRAVDFKKRGFFCEVRATFSESYNINGNFV